MPLYQHLNVLSDASWSQGNAFLPGMLLEEDLGVWQGHEKCFRLGTSHFQVTPVLQTACTAPSLSLPNSPHRYKMIVYCPCLVNALRNSIAIIFQHVETQGGEA